MQPSRRLVAGLGAILGLTVVAAVAYLLGLPDQWLIGWLVIAVVAAATLLVLAEVRRANRRTEELLASLRATRAHVEAIEQRVQRALEPRRPPPRARKVEQQELLANVSAVVTLHSLFQPRAVIPPPDKWAAMPDLQLSLVQLVLERRPALVVECGSGTSSVWLGYAAERVGGCRVVALEHHERFAAASRSLVAEHGLDHVVDVRLAPLEMVNVDGREQPWYAQAQWQDLSEIDVLLVDGPPAGTFRHARYPALPLLESELSEDAVVVMDDANRPDERAIVREWVEATGQRGTRGWTTRRLATARGTVLLESALPPPTPGQ